METNKQKVYLIVEDQPKTKVYARVFGSKENAEKALEEIIYLVTIHTHVTTPGIRLIVVL